MLAPPVQMKLRNQVGWYPLRLAAEYLAVVINESEHPAGLKAHRTQTRLAHLRGSRPRVALTVMVF